MRRKQILGGYLEATIGCCALMALVLLTSLAMPSAVAQVPSAEQIELLRTMSPEDREALLTQLGIGDSSLGSSAGASKERDTVSGTGAAHSATLTDLQRFDTTLRPDDSVIIDIDFIKPKPARVESGGNGLPPVSVPGEPAPPYDATEKIELQRIIDLVRSRNPYSLDRNGAIQLPGFRPIPLAGLQDSQATRRISAEPAFLKLDIKVVRLPLQKRGAAGLKPFGYDLFAESQSAFPAVPNLPVPTDYVVGAGDELMVQLYGSQNRNLKLVIGRDGIVNFPELGPIAVAGQSFEAVRSTIESRVSSQLIGVRASVSLGGARSIRVFVLGEATRPGSYTVSALANVTTALFASGGVKVIGSLRDVQLKRNGAVIRRIDLYDLLLQGDTSSDAKLQQGDVIFIPPISATVAVDGEVRRPAIYEIRRDTTVADVVALAGGLTPDADTSRVALVRVNDQRQRVIVDVPLHIPSGRSEFLRNGDTLSVPRLRPTLDAGVQIDGHVFRPGAVAWREGLRLSDVISSVDELKPNADINYVLIQREVAPDRRLTILSADLEAALRSRGSEIDVELEPRDKLIVFDTESGRKQFLEPLLEQLRRQSRFDRPTEVVTIGGRVNVPGDYPLENSMTISDLIRAGGGLQDAAYSQKAELTRYRQSATGRETELIEVDLGAIFRGVASADIALQPFDYINVKELPEWSEQQRVTLTGELKFPGTYPIRPGETLRSVLNRAGGLTRYAFPAGAVFTRADLRAREQEQLERLAERLQSDLAAAALQGVQANRQEAGQSLAVGQSLLSQLKSARAVGRLVLDLERVLSGNASGDGDVVLRDGDSLIVPKQKQEVSVIGEVQNSTSHLFRAGLSRDDYIGLSGGLTRKADEGRVYVVRADGSVLSSERSGWFRRSGQVEVRPGDTIVAPLDTERLPPLPLWQAVTQILYNVAISIAAVNSF